MGSDLSSVGGSSSGSPPPFFDAASIARAVREVRRPLLIVRDAAGRIGLAFDDESAASEAGITRIGLLPASYPEWLGERSFLEVHRVRFPYIAGAMANGIATAEMVVAMAKAGMLGFFGAAGLLPDRVERALDRIEREVGGASFGANLIASPNEPALEEKVAELYLARGIARISASAYVDLTPALVRFAASGLEERPDGTVARIRHVFAKVSRPEVARRFMSPAPKAILDSLVAHGKLTPREAALAARVPIAEDVTVEGDSGGHTDNQTLSAIFPVIARLRDRLVEEHRYARPIRLGAAGGLGTPRALAAAYSLGAAYVVTGSINQCTVEAGLSPEGKRLLGQATVGDVVMAPAADMFEQGVKVQVLRRGTMFAPRASRLYALYSTHPSLEAIPENERKKLETEIFGASIDEVWRSTEAFFRERDPREIERAARDPKHRMALVFRWYLGLSSRWAIAGEPERRLDYQIWCGAAMGAFNDWVRGSFLEDPAERDVVTLALNLLEGAAIITRAHQLRAFGVPVPEAAFDVRPRRLAVASTP